MLGGYPTPGSLGDLQHAQALLTQRQNVVGDLGRYLWTAQQRASVLYSSLQTGFDPFLNHRALEFGKHPAHLKQDLATGCAVIERLLMQIHSYALASNAARFVEGERRSFRR